MREPNRIPEILGALKTVWEANPDLRLGQLIVNAVDPTESCSELYHVEDNVLMQRLQEWKK